MLLINDKKQMVIGLESEAGRAIAEMVLQSMFTWGAPDSRMIGRLKHASRVIKGEIGVGPQGLLTLPLTEEEAKADA